MMQPAAPSAVRSAIAGRLRSGSSVWKLRATGLTSMAATRASPSRPSPTTLASMPSACSPATSVSPLTTPCSTSRAAPRLPPIATVRSRPAPAFRFLTRLTTPIGVPWSASAWSTASPRTGRSASNTITCSWTTRPTPSSTTALPAWLARCLAPIASVKTLISLPRASTTGSVARSSRSILIFPTLSRIKLRKAGLAPAFLFAPLADNFHPWASACG